MFEKQNIHLSVLIVLLVLRVQCHSKSISKSAASTKLTRVHEAEAYEKDNRIATNCQELSNTILVELLGEAYNSRYMSVNRPIVSDDVQSKYADDSRKSSYSVMKRKAEDVPSFYVDESHMMELSEMPAWDVKTHAVAEAESQSSKRRRRRSIADIPVSTLSDTTSSRGNNLTVAENSTDDSETARYKRAYGRNGANSAGSSNSDSRQAYPWKCEATVKWVDLGPEYFPRYLRNVECAKHYCWYKVFMCKPKSFAIKILHRRKGKCADAGNLKKITSYGFSSQYGEVWRWEEVAINFCCDCAIA